MLSLLKKIRKKLLNPILYQQDKMEEKIDGLTKEYVRINNNFIELRNIMNYYEKDPYDYILPIGKNCYPELILRHFGLYDEASPFGAMHNFINNYEKYRNISGTYGFKGKMELLVNNFENYLEKNDLEILVENDSTPPECPNMVIGNKRTGLAFYHTFPALGVDGIDISYETVKRRFDKRINSLLLKLNQSRKIMIVFIDINWNNEVYDKVEYIEDNVIYETSAKLQNKYPEKKFYYLFLEHDKKKSFGEIEKIYLENNIIRYRSNHMRKNFNIIWQYSNNNPKEYEVISIAEVLSKFRLNDNNIFN